MEHLRWTARPQLQRPVLIAAFEGWNDAGDAATTAARYLCDRWGAEPFASIEPEDFFDFTSARPHVQLQDGETREIVWPKNELFATEPGAALDAIVLVGMEPQLRWRTFCDLVVEVARTYDVSMVVTL